MLIGYARVSKTDDSQTANIQLDALKKAGVKKKNIYEDKVTGAREERPALESCLNALTKDDVLIVSKLNQLGRSLKHLVVTIHDLTERGIGFKVISGQGTDIDTTTAKGKRVFGIFAALAEFERDLISERTKAGLAAARARGRLGGRKFQLTKAQVRLAQAAMKKKDTIVSELADELGVTRTTLYRYVSPTGKLREYGNKVLKKKKAQTR